MGQSGRNVNVTINGVDNKDNTVGGPVMQLPLEAVQEFVISTQRFSAANGRSEGAAINMITKSGTNNYHGSAIWVLPEQQSMRKLLLRSSRGKRVRTAASSLADPSAARLAKDKLFGFFAFERQREHTSISEDSLALRNYRPPDRGPGGAAVISHPEAIFRESLQRPLGLQVQRPRDRLH